MTEAEYQALRGAALAGCGRWPTLPRKAQALRSGALQHQERRAPAQDETITFCDGPTAPLGTFTVRWHHHNVTVQAEPGDTAATIAEKLCAAIDAEPSVPSIRPYIVIR